MIFVSDIPVVKFKREINDSYIDNPYFSIQQFSKNYASPDFTWHMLFSDKRKCLAGAAVIPSYGPNGEYAYINEVQSLIRGGEYGKKIILLLKKFFGDICLMANPSVKSNALLKFYRDPEFEFDEYVVPADESPYEVETHYFATRSNVPKDLMLKFFKGES